MGRAAGLRTQRLQQPVGALASATRSCTCSIRVGAFWTPWCGSARVGPIGPPMPCAWVTKPITTSPMSWTRCSHPLEIIRLHGRRWDIEMAFNLVKTLLGLHLLWPSNLVVILQQVWAVLIISQILQALHLAIAGRVGLTPRRSPWPCGYNLCRFSSSAAKTPWPFSLSTDGQPPHPPFLVHPTPCAGGAIRADHALAAYPTLCAMQMRPRSAA